MLFNFVAYGGKAVTAGSGNAAIAAATAINDAVLARILAAPIPINARPALYFPEDPNGGYYPYSPPICPQTQGWIFYGDGKGRSTLLPTPTSYNPAFMFGFPATPGGASLTADHFLDARGVLDATAAPASGSRWLFRTLNNCHAAQLAGPLADGWCNPSGLATGQWADLDVITWEHFQDTTLTGASYSAPIFGIRGHVEIFDGPTTWTVAVYTQATDDDVPVQSLFRFPGLPNPGPGRTIIELNLATGTLRAAQQDRWVSVTPTWRAPQPGAGLRTSLVPNDGSPYCLGSLVTQSPLHGNEGLGPNGANWDRVFGGHHVLKGSVYAPGNVGEPVVRLDGKTTTDLLRYFTPTDGTIGLFTFADPPGTGKRWLTVQANTKSYQPTGMAYVALTQDGSNFQAMQGFEVRDLTIQGPSSYGDVIALGNALNTVVDGVEFNGGCRGVACWNWLANYEHVVRNCSFLTNRAAAYWWMSIADMRDIKVPLSGRYVVLGTYSEVTIARLTTLDTGTPKVVFKSIAGNMTIDAGHLDYEGNGVGPTRAVGEFVLGAGTGAGVQYFSITNLRGGNYQAGLPLVIVRGTSPATDPTGVLTLEGWDGHGGGASRPCVARIDTPNAIGAVRWPYTPPFGLLQQTYAGPLRVQALAPYPDATVAGSSSPAGQGGASVTVTYPVGLLKDDAGSPLANPTVTIASVVDKAGTAIANHGAVVRQAGGKVSVDYDPTKGEGWATLAVTQANATITGANAAPVVFLRRDTSLIQANLDAAVSSRHAAGAAVADVTNKDGYNLGPNGLNAVDPSEPAGPPTSWRSKMLWVFARLANAAGRSADAGTLTVHRADGTAWTTQDVADDGAGTESQGAIR